VSRDRPLSAAKRQLCDEQIEGLLRGINHILNGFVFQQDRALMHRSRHAVNWATEQLLKTGHVMTCAQQQRVMDMLNFFLTGRCSYAAYREF